MKKKLTGNQKLKIVMESFEKNNVSEVARKHSMHPNLLSTWRKKLLDEGGEIFTNKSDREKNNMEKKIKQLEHIIGKKEVEISLLQNFLDERQS